MPKNCENPEFMAKWKKHQGQWSDPEKAREAQKKSTESKKRNNAIRKQVQEFLTNPDGIREEVLTAILDKHPEAVQLFAEKLFSDAMREDSDKQAREIVSKMLGLDAPKRTEVKDTTPEMTPEEAMAVLMKAQKGEG